MYYNISNFSSQDIMKKKISIDNYYSNRRETAKINSPRSLKAIENLGYKPEQLKYLSFKEFCLENLEIYGKSKQEKKQRYEYQEGLRINRINEIKKERDKIKMSNSSNKFYQSKTATRFYNQSSKYLKCTELENQKRAFETMIKKNQKDLKQMIQNEITRELIRKKGELKLKQEQKKAEKQQKLMEKMRQKNEEEKRNKEKLALQKQKELEEYQKQLDKERYEEERKKEKQKEKMEKRRKKEAIEKHQEEERRRIEFQEKVDNMLEANRLKNVKRMKEMNEKDEQRKKFMELQNKERCEKNQEKAEEQKEKMALVIKKLENEKIKMKQDYLEKQRVNEVRKKMFEKQKLNDLKKREEEAQKKAEIIKQTIEQRDLLIQKRVDDYNKKQEIIKEKRLELEQKMNKENEYKILKNKEREEKMKQIKFKNDELMQIKKNSILAKIQKNEENTNLAKIKKDNLNQKIIEKHLEQELSKKIQIEKVAEIQKHKRLNILEGIQERNERFEEFQRQKQIINQRKKIMSEEMSRKKEEYINNFSKIFSNNSFNKKTIQTIKDMFPGDKNISSLLQEYSSTLDEK